MMSKNIFRKVSKIFSIAVTASLILASCNFGLAQNEKDEKVTVEPGNTLVKVNVSALSSASRTALPAHDLNNYLYDFSYKAADSSEEIALCEKESLIELNSIRKELRSGKNYTFKISAWSGESKILEGQTVVENLSGETYNASILLLPLKGLEGTAKVTVTYPDDGVIKTIKYVYSSSRNAVPVESVVSGAGEAGTKTFEIKKTNVPSGTVQYIIFEMYDAQGAVVYRRAESLYVVGGQTSISTIAIDNSYYYRKPVTVSIKKDGAVYSDSVLKVDVESNSKVYSLAKDSSGYYTGDVPADSYTINIQDVNSGVVVEAGKSAIVDLYTIKIPSSKVTLTPAEHSGIVISDERGNLVVPKNGNFTVDVAINEGYKIEGSATIGGKAYAPSVTLNQREIGTSEIIVSGIVPIDYSITYSDGAFILSNFDSKYKKYTIESDFALPVISDTAENNFGGWQISGTNTVISEIKPGRTGNLSLDAKWNAKDTAGYDIIYLFEDIATSDYHSDSSIKENTKGNGIVGSKTTITSGSAQAPVFDGFNNPVIENITAIRADGTSKVTVKYSRKVVAITFNAGENGSFDSGNTKTVSKKYGATVASTEIPVPVRTDYKLTGWTPALPAILTVPDSPVTYTAVWEQEYAGYTIEKWYQNKTDDSYTEAVSERDTSKKAKIGETVTASAPIVTGFNAKPVESVTVTADGSAVVKVYYDRKSVTISLDLDGGAIPGSDKVTYTGKYDAAVSLPATAPVKDGWEFVGWVRAGDTDTSALPSVYPATNITYKAKYNQTVASFTVKIYKQEVDGTYPTVEAKSFTTTGSIGQTTEVTQSLATIHLPMPEGFEWDKVENKTLAVSGTVVNVYYKRKLVTYTFNGNRGGWNGDTTKSFSVRYGAAISVPERPEFGTLIFAGWGTTSTADTITTPDTTAGLTNKTYYAVWKSKIDTGDVSDPIDPSKLNVDFAYDVTGTKITSTFTYPAATNPLDWEIIWQVNDRIVSGQTTNIMNYTGTAKLKYEVKLIAYYKGIPYIKTHTVELK